eukprot:7548134-Pyramimonas_sp.AAC.1
MTCERIGGFPTAARLVHLVMLLKPKGGFRPIGLLAWLPRWWARIRQRESRAWEAQLAPADKANFWGGQGKASEEAVWWQALHNEAADGRGACAGGVLLDLWKAYEVVSFAVAQQRAEAEGYPLALTAAALS